MQSGTIVSDYAQRSYARPLRGASSVNTLHKDSCQLKRSLFEDKSINILRGMTGSAYLNTYIIFKRAFI